jgi:hypothetical protein
MAVPRLQVEGQRHISILRPRGILRPSLPLHATDQKVAGEPRVKELGT